MTWTALTNSTKKNKPTLDASVQSVAEDIPFFLEILAYDEKIADTGSAGIRKVKPHKVIGAMKVFSDHHALTSMSWK